MKTITFVSEVPCLFQLNGINVKPGENNLSVDDFKKLCVHDDYLFFVSNGKIEESEEATELSKETKAEIEQSKAEESKNTKSGKNRQPVEPTPTSVNI